MAQSQIDIANRALLSIGARASISSFSPSDGSVESDAINILWSPTFEQLGRAAPWNCLTKQKTLTMLYAAQGTPENPDGTSFTTPPSPWLYGYVYPADCLLFRFVVPSYPNQTGSNPPATTISNSSAAWLPSGGQIPFAVTTLSDTNNTAQLMILTNQDQAQGVYNVNQQNPNGWDSLFQQAMVSTLGAYLVPALSLSLPLMKMSIDTAEAAIARARAQDGNEGVTSMDHTPDWMLARSGGSNWGTGLSTWGGYCNIMWPQYGSYGL